MPVEMKLQDLAKMALGVPQLTNVNIAILHSLIDILLKKLNCQNEAVTLGAYEAKHLETILQTSASSPLAFNDENVEIISHKLERLEKLEEKVNVVDMKLENHLKQLERQNDYKKTKVTWDNWESYGCEDLCTIDDADNDITCKLLQNTDFLKKLLRRISSPMVDRVFYFEEKLERLYKEFMEFIKRAEEEYLKIQLLEKCISEIEILRKKIKENQAQFLCTMEEIQDMLDAKLDKIHMPALKKYIRDNFQHIDQNINLLKAQNQCPKAAGIIMQGLSCVSCGDANVCGEVGVQPAALLPDMKTAQKSKEVKKYCGCSYEVTKGIKIHEQSPAKSLNLSKVVAVPSQKNGHYSDPISNLRKCRKAGEDFELLEGFDGNLYRKG